MCFTSKTINPNRLDCRCIRRNLFLHMLLLVSVRSHNRNIGICSHRIAHKYTPNIHSTRNCQYYILNPYEEMKVNKSEKYTLRKSV